MGILSIFMNIIQTLILCGMALVVIRRLRVSKGSVILVFFLYGIVCFMISDMYWLVMDLMYPQKRIWFGVNEIAEAGLHLLFAEILNAVFGKKDRFRAYEIVIASVYGISMTLLWIGWTSEWVKDIVGGLALGYFVLAVIRAIRVSGALKKAEWIAVCFSTGVLLALQGMIFAVPQNIGRILDVICYAIMFTITLLIFIRAIPAVIGAYKMPSEKNAYRALTFAMAGFAWTVSTLYMSSGSMYNAAMVTNTCVLPLMLMSVLAVEREGGTEK